jgi:hypothetical protein
LLDTLAAHLPAPDEMPDLSGSPLTRQAEMFYAKKRSNPMPIEVAATTSHTTAIRNSTPSRFAVICQAISSSVRSIFSTLGHIFARAFNSIFQAMTPTRQARADSSVSENSSGSLSPLNERERFASIDSDASFFPVDEDKKPKAPSGLAAQFSPLKKAFEARGAKLAALHQRTKGLSAE